MQNEQPNKYYTVCDFTPASPFGGYRELTSLYPQGEETGLLFYNNQGIEIKDVLKCLNRIAHLFEDATACIVAEVDACTLAATFSTSALPHPIDPRLKYHRRNSPNYEFLRENPTKVWFVHNVKDPNSAQEIDLNEMYDSCLRMERLSGLCPCPSLYNGQCREATVVPTIGRHSSTYYKNPHTEVFKRKGLETIFGFQYIPPSYTAPDFFTSSYRPWDSHDFSLVELRKAEYKIKGNEAKRRNEHRRKQCGDCAFKPVDKKNCDRIAICGEGVTETKLWSLLYSWLRETSGFKSIDGFTTQQRNFLIRSYGQVFKSTALGTERNIDTQLAGFRYFHGKETWDYQVSAYRGIKDRAVIITSWEEFVKYFPDKAAEFNPQEEPDLDDRTLLAAALAGRIATYPTRSYGNEYYFHHAEWHGGLSRIVLEGCNARDVFAISELNIYTDTADKFYTFGFGPCYERAAAVLTSPIL